MRHIVPDQGGIFRGDLAHLTKQLATWPPHSQYKITKMTCFNIAIGLRCIYKPSLCVLVAVVNCSGMLTGGIHGLVYKVY